MIFYFKADGSMIDVNPSEIYQGSNNANVCYVVCPMAKTNQVVARIMLPNGEILPEQLLTLKNELGEYFIDDNENGINVWEFKLSGKATSVYGSVKIQFAFTSEDDVLTTESVNFLVKKGILSVDDITSSDEDILEEILSHLSQLEGNFVNLTNKLDKNVSQTQLAQAYIKNPNGTQCMYNVSDTVGDSLVLRLVDGNILVTEPNRDGAAANKQYVDNKISGLSQTYYNKSQVDDKLDEKQDAIVDLTLLRNNINYAMGKVYEHDSSIEDLQDEKVDKVSGKGLSTNDFSTAEKTKLAGIEAGAEVNAPNTVIDANYVHTDNNYSTAEKTKLAGIEAGAEVNDITDVQNADGTSFVTNKIATIPDATETVKGLNTLPKEYELIEKIIVGYSVLTAKPESWYEGQTLIEQDLTAEGFTPIDGTFYKQTGSTTYTNGGIYYYNGSEFIGYYENTGTTVEPTYSILKEQKQWESAKYYEYISSGIREVTRRNMPDGTPYLGNLKEIILCTECPKHTQKQNVSLYFHSTGGGVSYYSAMDVPYASSSYLLYNCHGYKILSSQYKMYEVVKGKGSSYGFNIETTLIRDYTSYSQAWSDVEIRDFDLFVASGYSGELPSGSIIKIYGIRK